MKAVVYEQYGAPEVLHMADIPKPTPKDNEILVKVRAVTVGFGDLMARDFKHVTPRSFNMIFPFWLLSKFSFGLNAPKQRILGAEYAGEVEAVGTAVTRFKVGDAVFGYRGINLGAYVEYLCVPADGLVEFKPANLTYEEAAAIPYGAIMAFNLLKLVAIKPGDRVLINGASGAIGSAALQLAKLRGAQVTGVCGTARVELVRALGADRVVDYTREDFTRSSQRYDLILAVNGYRPLAEYRRALKPQGTYIMVGGEGNQIFESMVKGPLVSRRGGQTVTNLTAAPNADDLSFVKDLIEAGKVHPVIDQIYPLENTAEAVQYVGAGRAAGKVIIRIKKTL